MTIMIGCNSNDEQLKIDCINTFGEENVEIIERRADIGVAEIALIISIAQLTVQIIEFLASELSSTEEGNNANYRRVVISKDGDINLEGYTFDEAKQLLSIILDSKK